MNISQKLKNRRKELKLTLLQVAQKVGVSEGTISRWESGDIANMKRDKIVNLAEALQVSPAFIMDYEYSEDCIKKTDNTLTYTDTIIIEKYNKLNFKGQGKTDAYIDMLLENPEYCKENEIRLVAENSRTTGIIEIDDETEHN